MTALLFVLLAVLISPAAQAEQRPIEQPRSVTDVLQQCDILTIKIAPLDRVGQRYVIVDSGYDFLTVERPTATPVLAEKLTSVPGVRLDSQGRVALRDMQAHELGVVVDGSWRPGATLTSAKGGSPHVTPVAAAPFSIR